MNKKRLPHTIQVHACGSFEHDEWSGSVRIDVTQHSCARNRGRDGPHLDFCSAGMFRHVEQKLAATQINASGPFADTKDSLLAEARNRLILESQLTPGLNTGPHRRALANIIVHRSRTRWRVRWEQANVLDDFSHSGFFKLGRGHLGWEPGHKRKRKRRDRQNETKIDIHTHIN